VSFTFSEGLRPYRARGEVAFYNPGLHPGLWPFALSGLEKKHRNPGQGLIAFFSQGWKMRYTHRPWPNTIKGEFYI
jgi:hypothetical protein